MYQSQIDQRAAELEAADKRMDAHGEIITAGDIRAWERHWQQQKEKQDDNR